MLKSSPQSIPVPTSDSMQAFPEQPTPAEMPLQLLLFVDKRPSSREQTRCVREFLRNLRATYPFELEVIDVEDQPYLAEHFRLVATPALLKIHPEPRQTLAGSNLVAQVEHWWSYWQRSVEDYLSAQHASEIDSEGTETEAIETEESETEATETEGTETEGTETEATETEESAATATPVEQDPSGTDATSETLKPPANGLLAPTSNRPPGRLMPGKAIRSISRSAELIQLSDEVFRLKREKEELEHQLKFKDQIIAMLAHDLRNPLTAASIALETLEMGHDIKEGWSARLTPTLTAQLLKHARTQTRAIDRMITDILQAARGASSELHIQPHKLDLGHLCLDVLADLQDRLQAKSQRIKKDIPSDLPLVLADGERVRQVLVNLLDNAIKYTPNQGTIAVSILHRTTQKIQVSICDDGPGIPEENREHIFEDHFRLKRDEAQEGYGIGLSLCQRVIRAHYGQIWVDSVPNQGSCFHFTLPVFRA